MSTLKQRLNKLEADWPEDFVVEGVTIYCKPQHRDAVALPVEVFRIDHAGTSKTVKRRQGESEAEFVCRAEAIRDSFCQMTRGDYVPPSPIMWHVVDINM